MDETRMDERNGEIPGCDSKWSPGESEFAALEAGYAERFDARTMMALPGEHAYCHWLAESRYTGKAGLVELGCFLGSITRSLLAGLVNNREIPESEKTITVYDRFIWGDTMRQWVAGDGSIQYPEVGDSYRGLFEQQFADCRDQLDIHEADFSEGPVTAPEAEILIIDVMKDFDIAENVAKSFFPRVLPGGILLHQDYLQSAHGWIPLLTWQLRDYLRLAWLHPDPDVCTAVFEVNRPIPREACVCLTDCISQQPRIPRNPEEILEAFTWNKEVFPPEKEPLLLASEIFLLAITGYAEPRAREKLEEAASRGWLETNAFRDLLKRVSRMTWKRNWFGQFA